jgi:hypothetical protein
MVVVGFALTTHENLVKAFGVGNTVTAHWEFDLGGHSVKICLCSEAGRIPRELPELAYPWQVCSDVSVALRPDILRLVATRLNCAVWENSRVAPLSEFANPSDWFRSVQADKYTHYLGLGGSKSLTEFIRGENWSGYDDTTVGDLVDEDN